ncbi:MAG: DNA polymerase III subunit alpha [candidate division WOR-3 bacterium]|nr:DNA polymerase III subunit alpha [candidate division WOR-3 bacterium]
MKKANFVHLHNHTEYSLLDGAIALSKLVNQAAKYKMPALALTDHGNLFGAIEFYKLCYAQGITPIIGAEVYVAVGSRKDRTISKEIPESSFHLTLLSKNLTGYHNLIKLVSLGYLEGFYYRPRIDKELLAQYAEGLIALSGCLKGEVNYYLLQDNYDKAREIVGVYQDIMGRENFYLEIMRLGLPDTEKLLAGLRQLSYEMGSPLVATNDCHFLDPYDAKAHDVLVCIQTGKKLSEDKRLKFESQDIYFKSPEEMTRLFADIPEAITNTLHIAEQCNLILPIDEKEIHLPAFPLPEGFSQDMEYLVHLTNLGLKERYRQLTSEVTERLKYELKIIGQMGFAGYFLIVKDIIDYAKSKGVPVGPGRGSAVSSLVLYCLGITDIDPIKYGLVFERFLNPERVSLPDIDIDFADNKRSEVIDYIRHRYGENSVAQIITFGTMASRAVVRDVGRVLDIPYAEVDRIAKLIPLGMEIGKAIGTIKELKDLIESSAKYKELLEIAVKLENLARHASIHASGIVIAPKPLLELVPLYRSQDNEICTQYDMDALAEIGLLKLDILGLKTLTVIEDTLKICTEQGKPIDKKSIPFDDKKTYQLLQRAETTGLFQIESQGMRDILRKSKPEKIEDLCAVIALYRPGPMANIDEYIKRKLGNKKIEYFHHSVEPILKETYGIMVYQEQVMQIAKLIAGFTPTQYDRLRRAMGKKIPEEMKAMQELFIQGAKHHRIPEKKAEQIFELISPFAGYGFNKSHSMGYAHLSYLTAYLKANYPVEYMTALLSNEIGDSDKLNLLIKECRRMKIDVLPPDVNFSDYKFSIEDNKIRYGLGGIKNLGEKVCLAIKNERILSPYSSFRDFLRRTRKDVNRKAYESLIKAGALDSLEKDRSYLLSILESELEKVSSERLLFLEKQGGLFTQEKPTASPYTPLPNQSDILTQDTKRRAELQDTKTKFLQYEKEAFGFYFSGHPLENYELEYSVLRLKPIATCQSLTELKAGRNDASNDYIIIGGVITSLVRRKDKKGKDYIILQVEDFTASTEIIAFNEVYERCRQFLKPDLLVIIRGKMNLREEVKTQLEAKEILPFEDWVNYYDMLTIAFNNENFNQENLSRIKSILSQYPGSKIVRICLLNNKTTEMVLELGSTKVTFNRQLLQELTEVVNQKMIIISRLKSNTIY